MESYKGLTVENDRITYIGKEQPGSYVTYRDEGSYHINIFPGLLEPNWIEHCR